MLAAKCGPVHLRLNVDTVIIIMKILELKNIFYFLG